MDLSELTAAQLITLRLALAVAAATLGSLVAVAAKKVDHFGLCLLISFAAGALLAVSLFDILPESIEVIGLWPGLASFASGYLLFFLLTKFVFHVCPACAATHTEINFKGITAAMVVALSVHSFMDGVAISSGSSTGSAIGILILLAVAYHKFPEGMALALVAAGSGMGRRRAFWTSCLIESSTTLIGGTAGFFIPALAGSQASAYLIAHAGGGFVFIVLHALLSEVVRHRPRYTVLAAVAGAASVLFIQFFVL